MDNPLDQTASETIRDLTLRLRRIEYLLQGNTTSDGHPAPALLPTPASREETVRWRLEQLDKALLSLYNHCPTAKGILDLYVQHPHLFQDPTLPTPLPQHVFPAHTPPLPPSLTPGEKLSTILSTASSLQAFSSQLNAIVDSPIPNPMSSAELVGLIPRVNRVEALQAAQGREMAELRGRTVRVLERWYLVGVEGVNECVAEWDERTLGVERGVGRVERAVVGEGEGVK